MGRGYICYSNIRKYSTLVKMKAGLTIDWLICLCEHMLFVICHVQKHLLLITEGLPGYPGRGEPNNCAAGTERYNTTITMTRVATKSHGKHNSDTKSNIKSSISNNRNRNSKIDGTGQVTRE